MNSEYTYNSATAYSYSFVVIICIITATTVAIMYNNTAIKLAEGLETWLKWAASG